MAKNIKVILTDPAGKRVDQRLSGPQEEGGLAVDLYGLVLADGSLVEMVLPCRQHELMVNWSSSEAAPAEKIRRRLVRQAMNARDFDQHLLAMDATAGSAPAQLFILRYPQPDADPETRGPFPVEPGKPWKLTFEHPKRTAAVVVIGSGGVCVKSDIFGPAGIYLEYEYPGRLPVEVAPTLSPSEMNLVNADDVEAFRSVVLSRLDAQGISAGDLRFGGRLGGFFRSSALGLASAMAIGDATNCWREVVAFECERRRLCVDGAERKAFVNGKSVKMPPATVWQNGFAFWPTTRLPEIVESTCPPVFRLAIKQGQAEKARDFLMKFGGMDGISGLNIGDLVRETLSRVEEEAISEAMAKGASPARTAL